MDLKLFTSLVEDRIQKYLKVLITKGKMYGRREDRLYQFKEIGMRKHETPEMALHGMADKHNLSIFDMVRDIEGRNYEYITLALMDEKFGDAHNYLHMLEALITERIMRDDLLKENAATENMENNDG